MQQDAELWSGCISGAFEESAFLQAFVDAGLEDVQILSRQAEAWQEVEGIEFRSMTVVAYRPLQTSCCAPSGSVIYHGPFAEIADDAGHLFQRGRRQEVDAQTFAKLGLPPFTGCFTCITAEGKTKPATSDSSCCG